MLLTQNPEYADLQSQLQVLTFFMAGDISIDSYNEASKEFDRIRNKLFEMEHKSQS
jgi:hypothetical protein